MSILEEELHEALAAHVPDEERRVQIQALLAPLKYKSPVTYGYYEHCIRVGLLAGRIGQFLNLPEGTKLDFVEGNLFVAGLLHDIGKALVDPSVLEKGRVGGFENEEMDEMRKHVIRGYELVRGTGERLDFIAEIVVRHHSFQGRPYPDPLPPYLHDYSLGERGAIESHAKILALADMYDSLHRARGFSGEEIRERMFTFKQDQAELLEGLYQADIFTISDEMHT